MKPTKNFNFLVTLKGHKSEVAGEEVLGIEEIELELKKYEPMLNIKDSEFPNVLLIDLSMDTRKALEILKNSTTTVISKIVIIDEVVRTRPNIIKEKVLQIARTKIKSGSSFAVRCDLRGRKYIKSKNDLVKLISNELIENLNIEENSTDPDWIVQIEIIGEDTGISVSKPSDILKKD
ncbi:MAG: THUMP domain-containing protein [Methanobacteriaceae archaeon]|nr:THUMP domain-containing protein [Methanobacteriaceae archaeon]